jgi:hypothetical protein
MELDRNSPGTCDPKGSNHGRFIGKRNDHMGHITIVGLTDITGGRNRHAGRVRMTDRDQTFAFGSERPKQLE